MNDETRRNDFYTVVEASDVLGRSVPTIYRWMKLSKLRSKRNPVTRQLMVYKRDVAKLREWT